MVNLTRIYTRTGDDGQTRLSDNQVAAKTDLRVEAYGDVDEANSAIGVALAGDLPAPVRDCLVRVQNDLFDVGADLSTPLNDDPPWPPLRIAASSVDWLESQCDLFGDPLPALRSFILPGGSASGAQLHVARTITRRAERAAWRAVEHHGLDVPGGLNRAALTYLNRLSDLLFILSRSVTTGAGTDLAAETLWVPGGAERDLDGGAGEHR